MSVLNLYFLHILFTFKIINSGYQTKMWGKSIYCPFGSVFHYNTKALLVVVEPVAVTVAALARTSMGRHTETLTCHILPCWITDQTCSASQDHAELLRPHPIGRLELLFPFFFRLLMLIEKLTAWPRQGSHWLV